MADSRSQGLDTMPDRDDTVQKVIIACECSKLQANLLLEMTGGDADQAIERHRSTLARYGMMSALLATKPSQPDENGHCWLDAAQSGNRASPDIQSISSHDDQQDEVGAGADGSPVVDSPIDGPLGPHRDTSPENSRDDVYAAPTNGDKAEQALVHSSDWDFVLPIPPERSVLLPGEYIDIEHLVSYLHHDQIEINVLRDYLTCYNRKTVCQELNKSVFGIPTIFYAAATNNDTILRLWIEHGAVTTATHPETGLPLLAFAIIYGERAWSDTTTIVATLLSLGASPHVIPSDLYCPYSRDLDDELDETDDIMLHDGVLVHSDPRTAWCYAKARSKLAKTLNLVQRYYLERATKLKQPPTRLRQVARLRKSEPLLGIQYFLIGQTVASNILLKRLVGYLTIPTRKPLVLTFAGPSGHGKTELARQLGHLLNLPLQVVDCTTFSRNLELFGPRHPYQGADEGSPLNNFLVGNAGRRCIVFLDEFEKTTTDIHQSLLIPFDNGEYEDRRNGIKIDCSKTIWILATNALDQVIMAFCDMPENAAILKDEESREKDKLATTLSKALKQAFLARFEAPVTGRISEFVPFLPFNKGEQGVVVRKFLLELERRIRMPVIISQQEDLALLGDIRLIIMRDGAVCRALADTEYNPALGSRSLAGAVKIVEDQLVKIYLEEEEEIAESDELSEYLVDVRGDVVFVIKPGQ